MTVFRLIQDSIYDGAFNMAADLFLAEQTVRTGAPILRLYGWKRPTLSLGFHQKADAEIIRRCRGWGVPVVRRPTGGRAVLHDRELTYCFVAPLTHPLMQAGRSALLKAIGSAFVDAAARSGLKAELVRISGSEAGSETFFRSKNDFLCFSSVSRWEVRLNGCKWIGSAQRILKDAFLQHGSIVLGPGAIPVGALFQTEQKNCFGDCDLTSLESSLRRTIPEAFRKMWGGDWREDPLSSEERDLIERKSSWWLRISGDLQSERKTNVKIAEDL
jgi:lipoate-protein ligase A